MCNSFEGGGGKKKLNRIGSSCETSVLLEGMRLEVLSDYCIFPICASNIR